MRLCFPTESKTTETQCFNFCRTSFYPHIFLLLFSPFHRASQINLTLLRLQNSSPEKALASAKMADPQISKRKPKKVSLGALARIASIAAGVQFGWALQLSLLTPYIQELGIPHAWASYIWLCGPISGMLVQPLVGHLSDQCESPWGRRRPFILTGAVFIAIAIVIIAFSADLGYLLGDSPFFRPRAILIFVLGFWVLDLANNTLQGPCRALLADFTGKDHSRSRKANAFFSMFMAVGNVLGYATGAYNAWYKIFSFTQTQACGVSCANLKAAFLLGIVVMIITTALSLTAAEEIPWSPHSHSYVNYTCSTMPLVSHKTSRGDKSMKKNNQEEDDEPVREAFLWEIFSSLRDLPKPMLYILLITGLTWIAWFPFVLFDTDWMGREVFSGEPSLTDFSKTELYNKGVRMGSFGLMLNSVVLGLTSLMIEILCCKIGQRALWATANVIMFLCFVGTAIIGTVSTHSGTGNPSVGVLTSALLIFAILGAPLAVTYSVPYALIATVTNISGGGQGLSMGLLNLALVIPQIIISVGSGPWDELFGGGNMPAFLLAAVAALFGGILAAFLLPNPPPKRRSRREATQNHSSYSEACHLQP